MRRLAALHTLPDEIRLRLRLLGALGTLIVLTIAGTLGFMWVEDLSRLAGLAEAG